MSAEHWCSGGDVEMFAVRYEAQQFEDRDELSHPAARLSNKSANSRILR
jgi:hypothetical protein